MTQPRCFSHPPRGAPDGSLPTGSIGSMTASNEIATERRGTAPLHQVNVLLYSDDITTRDAVRAAVGRRPARDVEVVHWLECATAAAVVTAVESEPFDILILDGEAAKVGGLGLARQL